MVNFKHPSTDKEIGVDINSLLAALRITENTTRSAAKKLKPDDFHMCAKCLRGFDSRCELMKHCKKEDGHRVISKLITDQYRLDKGVLAFNRHSAVAKHNYMLSLTRVNALEKFRK